MTEILFARKIEADEIDASLATIEATLAAATFIVSSASGDLGAERVATSGSAITVDTTSPGVITWSLADMAQATLKGRASGAGTGTPQDLSASQGRTVLGLASSGSPEFAGINVGHASDTTITRSSAGIIAVEGVKQVGGPSSATANALPRFSGTSGALVKNSGVTLSDANVMAWPDEDSRMETRMGLGGRYVSIFDYTPNGAEVADYTPYLNAAVADAVSRAIRTIYFPERNYSFLSQPDPFSRGMNIVGDGAAASILVFKNYRGYGLNWLEDVATGGSIRHCGVYFQADQQTITGITRANPAVVTVTGHTFVNGDKIVIRDVGGMTQVNNLTFTVANKTANTFELSGVNSSAYGVYTTGGYAQLVGSIGIKLGGGSVPPGTVQAANFVIEDIIVSGGLDAIQDYPILVAGENYLFGGPGAGSGGVRNCVMYNVRTFNAATTQIELRNARGWTLYGVETNQGNGLVNNIIITGVSADYLSADVKLMGVRTTDLSWDWAAQCVGSGLAILGTAATSANCTNVRMTGYADAWSNGGGIASNTFNGAVDNFSGGNDKVSISRGGTNATTAADARTNLGLAIGSNVQAWDATLDTVAAYEGVRQQLTGARTYYVRTDGSDSNTGLVDSAGGAFLTIQKAIDTVATLDIGTNTVTIQVRDGTYTGANTLKSFVGSGTALITGNTGTPANVVISTTSASCFTGNNVRGSWQVQGMTLQTTTSGNCFILDNYTTVTTGAGIVFGACAGIHVLVQTGARFTVGADYTISGGASNHILTQDLGAYIAQTKTVTLSGTPAFTTFVISRRFGETIATGITYSGSATGSRYSVSNVGIIHTNGGGTTYFPGDAAGAGTNTATSPYGMYI